MQMFLVRLRRAILTSGVAPTRDNTHFHSAVVTQQLLKQFKWDVPNHSAYNLDLATSDFRLFPKLKNCLGVQISKKMRRFKDTLKPISHHL
ncbi:hypothetical protein AVEN_230497-1 [Araneus ventricosus]|uniref:Uncharacterized protein n=1 Tax=Araneus ventricosus TaxID=182803 RepID=A0A4Y2IFB1_ARAVE|nr:hypothetical protein AVEN_230497-1 [Araneus ventricosus]